MNGPIDGGAGPRAVQVLRLRRAAAGWALAALLLGTAGAATTAAGAGRAAAAAPTPAPTAARQSATRPSAAVVTTGTTGTTGSTTTTTTTPVVTTTITATTSLAPAKTAWRGPCLPTYGPMIGPPVTLVTSKSGVTTATWWHNGDPGAIRYWLGTRATSGSAQQQATTYWTRITPPAKVCQSITLVVPGVPTSAKGRWVIWLDLESRTPETKAQISRRTLRTLSLVL